MNAFVSVVDQGIGVPDPDRYAIYAIRRGGSNVGLSLDSGVDLAGAARLVALAGGVTSVSAADGLGATFVVRRPWSMSDKRA